MSIQTINATIQMRKGLEQDFDADQMTAGEWAVSTDAKYVRMCFAPGVVLRMATYEAFEQDMLEIQTILSVCQDIQEAVEAFEQLAEQHSSQAEEWSVASRSWAVGGTSTREGEDTNNSKYWSQQSKSEADRAKSEADRASSIVGFDIDSELSSTSTNPVQNKVITEEINKIVSREDSKPNAFKSTVIIPITSAAGFLKIAKLKKSDMLRADIPDSEALTISFSCTPTDGSGVYDQSCKLVITETWAGSKARILNSTHVKSAIITQVRKVYDDEDQMYYMELEANVPSCPCKLDISFESGAVPWEPIESIQFDTGGGGVNEIYKFVPLKDEFDNIYPFQEGIVNKYDDYECVTPSELPFTNVLTISPEKKGAISQKKYAIAQNNVVGFLDDLPWPLRNTDSVIYRDVLYRSEGHVLLVLTEAYPVSGRVWTAFYNYGVWMGWKCNQGIPLYIGDIKVSGSYQCADALINYTRVEMKGFGLINGVTPFKFDINQQDSVFEQGQVFTINVPSWPGFMSYLRFTISGNVINVIETGRLDIMNNYNDTTVYINQLHITRIYGYFE